ncbi:hypothetical protein Q0590_35955 [Rhodocytophaga aerolata]|uniref:Uncharacterized protein n=1 Tax=Rhodocytophaga aerolata TaxID=455078 RepID=A0ABT8RI04_9BACT|nr:hypothetical protein [Rhodocytophaga aerolata]MDO1451724.1 hypothetical protein [Rhodocytophaga aerolata]
MKLHNRDATSALFPSYTVKGRSILGFPQIRGKFTFSSASGEIFGKLESILVHVMSKLQADYEKGVADEPFSCFGYLSLIYST